MVHSLRPLPPPPLLLLHCSACVAPPLSSDCASALSLRHPNLLLLHLAFRPTPDGSGGGGCASAILFTGSSWRVHRYGCGHAHRHDERARERPFRVRAIAAGLRGRCRCCCRLCRGHSAQSPPLPPLVTLSSPPGGAPISFLNALILRLSGRWPQRRGGGRGGVGRRTRRTLSFLVWGAEQCLKLGSDGRMPCMGGGKGLAAWGGRR